ncbi:uncharacterized protein LOC109004054 [Juglans regia]|uniref:Uncharacterized protein LOC109004054 n=2 Tax=Juglans regia TaxID=51240 RepID=A0A6P9EWB2_JUGRE|nr:uncharacterized protein LOC109004054 [Juglans regia]XP_035548123.1 uncharacterized protein LOC109004054 [Juglans regia]
MDFRIRSMFFLLVLSSLLCSQARAEITGSVFFIDSSARQFLRTPSSNDAVEPDSMLPSEVGAAVSVLLGFLPPATLSSAGSSKLNDVLMPNPFDRPRAVFMLDVQGTDPKLVVNSANALFSSSSMRKVSFGLEKAADIQLPDENKVSVFYLDELFVDYTDKEIGEFASWMGGSYVADSLKPLNGELTIPLADGTAVNLHMSKNADREFTASLLSLICNFKKALELHEDLVKSAHSPAELIMGCFDGIKALQEHYGSEGFARHGVGLLLATLSKMFDSFQEAYQGQIVGVVFFSGSSTSESGKMLNVVYTSQTSARWLVDSEGSHNMTDPRVLLVRRTLAWITGIILLISTLLGVYFLLNMPITRDTLLYSNVKLD